MVSTSVHMTSLTINPPDVTEVTFSHSETVVWTKGQLTINFKSSYDIVQDSVIELEVPVAYSASSTTNAYFIESASNDPGCIFGTSVISCTFDSTTGLLKVSGAFPANVASGTSLTLKVDNVFTPRSTTPFAGFNLYITNFSGRKYLKKLDMSIQATSAKIVDALNIVHSGKEVGKKGTLIIYLTVSAFVDPDFWIEAKVDSNSGLDLSEAYFLGFDEKNPATALTVQGGWNGLDTSNSYKLQNYDNTIILKDFKNRDWVQDSQIIFNIYDVNNNIAQKSELKTLTFVPANIGTLTLGATPSILGAPTTLSFKWAAVNQYVSAYKLYLTTPAHVLKETVDCKNGENGATCDVTDDLVTISAFFTGTVAPGTESDLRVSGLRMPYCSSDSLFSLEIKTSQDGQEYGINSASIILPSSDLIKDTMTFTNTASTSGVSAESTIVTLNIGHTAILKAASKIKLTLDPEISWLSGSSCAVVSGLDSAATCTHSSGLLTIENGLSTERTHGGVDIQVQLASIGNPRGLGTYPITGIIETSDGAICQYAEGETSIQVTDVGQLDATLTPAINNRNIFTTYTISFQPDSAAWYNTDYVEVVLPSGANMAISESPNCVKKSPNLISVSCEKTSDTTIRVNTNINAATYATDRNIEFDIQYIQNADSQSTVSGFQVIIKTQSGGPYLVSQNLNAIFAGFVQPELTDAVFSSDKKGDDSYVTVNIKADVFIPAGGEFELEFVDPNKFILSGEETLKSSTPSMQIKGSAAATEGTNSNPARLLIDTANRKIRVVSNADINPNTDVSFEINMKGPLSNTVAGPDLAIRLFLNDRMVFENDGFSQQYSFICDPLCLDCERFFYHCTSCVEGKVLKADNSCGDPERETLIGTSAPFLFTFSAVFLFVAIWINGKYRRNRNFSGNFYYSSLKILYPIALLFTTLFFAINKDPSIYSIVMLVMFLIHIGLSWHSARSWKTVLKDRKFGGCALEGPPAAGKPDPMFFTSANDFIFHKLGQAMSTKKEDSPAYIKKVGEEKEKKKLFKIYSHQAFVIFFSNQVTRIFFSSTSKGKSKEEKRSPVTDRAVFWTWDQETFRALQRSYSKHRNYYLFFQFLVVVVLIFSCLGIGQTEVYIYLFKFDLGLVTLIDIIAYTYAYNELHPRKKKKGKKQVGKSKSKGNKVQPATIPENREESIKIIKNAGRDKDESNEVSREKSKLEDIFKEIEDKDSNDGGDSGDQDPTNAKKVVSVARSNAMNSDSFMSNLVIGTTKNIDAINGSEDAINKRDKLESALSDSGGLLKKRTNILSKNEDEASLGFADLGSEAGDSLPDIGEDSNQGKGKNKPN